MSDIDYFAGSHNPRDFFRSLVYDLRFYRNNPFYFDPWGWWIFCGAQSSGKTLSAVRTLKLLLHDYPGAIVCTNLDVKGIDRPVVPFTSYEQICTLTNGIYGVVYLIDEIHLLWNSLESKKIPFSEMAAFCQMRKDRRIILGTSQVFGRIAKPVREQIRYVIMCQNFLKYLQVNRIVDPNAAGMTTEEDGHIDGSLLATQWFFHTPEDYGAYETLNKIQKIKR